MSLGEAAEQVGTARLEVEELPQVVGFTALYSLRTIDQLAEEVDVASDADE